MVVVLSPEFPYPKLRYFSSSILVWRSMIRPIRCAAILRQGISNHKGTQMTITNDLLAAVFADASLFCGKEDVIHAIIHHQMTKTGISPLRIAREQMLSGNRVDVVLFGDGVSGDFATTKQKPLAVIEVKGGA